MGNVIEELETGDYQKEQKLKFELWAETTGAKEKEIEKIRAVMWDFEKGGIFHNYTDEGIRLRTRIQRALWNIEEHKNKGSDDCYTRVILSAFLADAVKIIKAEAGRKVSDFELAAVLRFRFTLSFDKGL